MTLNNEEYLKYKFLVSKMNKTERRKELAKLKTDLEILSENDNL